MKRWMILVITLALAVASVPSWALAEKDSHVIGRIPGTYQPVLGYFHQHPHLLAMGIQDVEITGFRLIRKRDGKKFLIRPNRNGFFYQALPGGFYTFVRKRTDRPDRKTPKTIDLLSFEVKTGTLVNIGTINIVLNGKPREFTSGTRHRIRATYTYNYRYERVSGDRAYDAPLNWFVQKKSSVADSYIDSVITVDTQPTSEPDGSKKTLSVHVPRDER